MDIRQDDVQLKFLCCSDLHDELQAKEFLLDFARSEKPDCVLIAGDIAEDSVNFCEEVFEELETAKIPFFAVHGNKDSEQVRDFIASTPYGIDGKCAEFSGYKICGAGGSTATPFGTPSEYSEEHFEKLYAGLAIDNKTIIVSHAPPFGTRSADTGRAGSSAGCKALRSVIEEKKPLAVVCGHVHEQHLTEKLRETVIVKVAPLMGKHAATMELPSLEIRLL